MLSSFAAVAILAAGAAAYSVTTPSDWTTVGPNTVTWSKVSTDPSNFTILLVNQNTSVLSNSENLGNLVDGSSGSFSVPTPSGGYPAGSGFQINFVQDSDHLSSILAQSQTFNITQSSAASSSALSRSATHTSSGSSSAIASASGSGASGSPSKKSSGSSLTASFGLAAGVAVLGSVMF